ncbi:sugar transferase [Sulfitobacter aestuariivivens]|uniref:Sugar transferase n=1 Tax=Sulfitobacter aestuariivivens TaxID=2766981 RepID=A0A927HFX7_9RHOB|nr:sugar transferase [Sulfitobacter aestuariivivens]MBD3665396.1 sugar transferase [Sulfitobacter aestuariivivens]
MAQIGISSDAQRLTTKETSYHTDGFYLRYGKRILDISLSLAALPLFGPLIGLIWILVRLSGPAGFFAHHRVGRNGVAFSCWKIQTMVPDADRQLADILARDPAAQQEWARTQKLRNDPRTTALGRFLRRTSLDELPQIWNVLRGDMSLVGPRPVTESELARYGVQRHSYLACRPGITGLWQIEGRGDGCYDQRLRLDRRYAQTCGLMQDIGLLLRTTGVVFRSTGV